MVGDDTARVSGSSENALSLPAKVRRQLVADLSESRLKLTSLERQRAQVTGLGDEAAQLEQLSRLYASQSEWSRIDIEYTLANAAFVEASTALQAAQEVIATGSAPIKVLDRAVPPARPVLPQPLRNMLMVVAVAFMITALGVLIAAHWRVTHPLRAVTH